MNRHCFSIGSLRRRRTSRRGMALLVVVVLVMMIAIGAYRFSFYMESQYRLTRLNEEQSQARLASLSGLEYAASVLERPTARRVSIGWPDNAGLYRDVLLSGEVASTGVEQEKGGWRFSLVAPPSVTGPSGLESRNPNGRGLPSGDGDKPLHYRFGFENESAKIHLPTLLKWDQLRPGWARAVLMGLPGAEESTVDGWLQMLGRPSPGTASSNAGMDLGISDGGMGGADSFHPDALRMLWYGGDFNQNYQVEPLEQRLTQNLTKSKDATFGRPTPGKSDTAVMMPWNRYLTWRNGERNESREGSPRIFLNDPDLPNLHRRLLAIWPAEWANFVVAYRQYGVSMGGTARALPTNSNNVPSNAPSRTGASQSSSPGAGGTRANAGVRSPGLSAPSSPAPPVPIPPSNPLDPRITLLPPSSQSSSGGMQAPLHPRFSVDSASLGGVGGAPSSSSGGGGAFIPSPSSGLPQPEYVTNWQPDMILPPRVTISSVLDLIGAEVELPPVVQGAEGSNASAATGRNVAKRILRSPFSNEMAEVRNYLRRLLDQSTVDPQPIAEGKIDVSEAPLEVLIAIPTMDIELAKRIIEQRSANRGDEGPRDTLAWMVESGLVDVARLRSLEPFATSRSDVYSVQSIGYRDPVSPVYRTTAIVDARQIPALTYQQQIWHPWDRGFDIAELASPTP